MSLRYESAGSGPPIVMLHEMGGSLESWNEIADVLSLHHRMVRYDQRVRPIVRTTAPTARSSQ